MTAPLSQDLRERIVRAVEGGSTIRQAARRFAVSASAAVKLMQRVRQTGSTAPAKIGGYRRPLLEKHANDLRALVASHIGPILLGSSQALFLCDRPRRCSMSAMVESALTMMSRAASAALISRSVIPALLDTMARRSSACFSSRGRR